MKFDEMYPEIDIPDEVIPQVDNDWPMTEEEENELVDAYREAREE